MTQALYEPAMVDVKEEPALVTVAEAPPVVVKAEVTFEQAIAALVKKALSFPLVQQAIVDTFTNESTPMCSALDQAIQNKLNDLDADDINGLEREIEDQISRGLDEINIVDSVSEAIDNMRDDLVKDLAGSVHDEIVDDMTDKVLENIVHALSDLRRR